MMAVMTGKKALTELLRHEDVVEYVLGIPGVTEVRFMDTLEEASDWPDDFTGNDQI